MQNQNQTIEDIRQIDPVDWTSTCKQVSKYLALVASNELPSNDFHNSMWHLLMKAPGKSEKNRWEQSFSATIHYEAAIAATYAKGDTSQVRT